MTRLPQELPFIVPRPAGRRFGTGRVQDRDSRRAGLIAGALRVLPAAQGFAGRGVTV